jgi:hypothetical protein
MAFNQIALLLADFGIHINVLNEAEHNQSNKQDDQNNGYTLIGQLNRRVGHSEGWWG